MKNDNFLFDDLWSQIIDLRSNLSEKRYRGMKRATQCFFEFLLAIIPFEILVNVCEKA